MLKHQGPASRSPLVGWNRLYDQLHHLASTAVPIRPDDGSDNAVELA